MRDDLINARWNVREELPYYVKVPICLLIFISSSRHTMRKEKQTDTIYLVSSKWWVPLGFPLDAYRISPLLSEGGKPGLGKVSSVLPHPFSLKKRILCPGNISLINSKTIWYDRSNNGVSDNGADCAYTIDCNRGWAHVPIIALWGKYITLSIVSGYWGNFW